MSSSGTSPIQVDTTELRKALWKAEFRALFPELKDGIHQFLSNPNCKCNAPLFNSLLQARDRLEQYFGPEIEVVEQPVTEEEVRTRTFVINTSIDLLEKELRRLPVGPKHISLARFEDQITAVVQLLS